MIQYRLCFTNVGKNISITSSWRITDQTFERRHYNNSNSSCWLIQRSRFIPSFTGTGSLEWKTGKTWWVKQVRWRLAREGGGGGGNRTEELYQGHSQDFSRGTHNFSNLPPPPNSTFDPQKHSHRHNRALLCLLQRQAWVKNRMFMFYTILLAICTHFSNYHPTFRCGKISPLLHEKYSKESKRVKQNWGNLYCLCCCFNFYTFFF